MKSFQEFIIEKNRKDYGRKGGEGGVKGTRITPSDRSDARARIQDTSYSTPSRGQRATPATPSELMSAWKEGGAGRRTVVGTPSKPESGMVFGSDKEAIKQLRDLERSAQKKPSQSFAAASDVSPQMRTQAADTAARASQTKPPTRRPLGDTTVGGPVKTLRLGDPGAPSKEAARTLQRMIATKDPVKVQNLQANLGKDAEKSKSKVVKQADVSKKAEKYRAKIQQQALDARKKLKASGTQFFGRPTGVDAQGKPTYVPPAGDTGEPGRRAQRQSSPRSYASMKAEIEGAKGFGGTKSGGLEMRTPPKPVTDYRQKRASRAGLEDPFTPKSKPFSQAEFEKGLRKTVKKQVMATGSKPTPTAPDPFKGARSISKSKPAPAPDRTATKQAVRDLKTSKQRLNIGSPETGGKVAKKTTTSVPTKKNALAIRSGSPLHQGAFDAAKNKVSKVKVKEIKPTTYRGLGAGAKDVVKPSAPKATPSPSTTPKVKLPKGSTISKGRFSGTLKVGKSFKDFDREIQKLTGLKDVNAPAPAKVQRQMDSMPDTTPAQRRSAGRRYQQSIKNTIRGERKNTAKQIKKEFAKVEKRSTGRFKAGAAALSGIGAYKEFGYGKQMAKQRGASDLEANIAGGLRAGGAFLGGVGGALAGRKVAGSVGAIGAGTVGYSKGAEAGTWLSRKLRGL